MDDDSVLVASSELVAADLSTETTGAVVILTLTDGVYYELNDVGTRVWQLLQSPCRFSDIMRAIVDEYDVDAARCEEDIRSLVAEMMRNGLIESRQGPAKHD